MGYLVVKQVDQLTHQVDDITTDQLQLPYIGFEQKTELFHSVNHVVSLYISSRLCSSFNFHQLLP